MIVTVSLIIIYCITLLICLFYISNLKLKLNQKIEQDNEFLKICNDEIERKQYEYNSISSAVREKEDELKKLLTTIEEKDNELKLTLELIPARNEQLNTIRESIAIARDNYDKELEIKKQEIDKDYEEHINAIQDNISNVISAYGRQCESLTETIRTYQNYVNSFIEAKKRALEQESNLEFYKLNLSEIDINDIEQLLKLSNSFSKPDILRKLVYKTYFEKSMNDLLGRVIGVNSEVSGVYKITHIDTKMCYIGQAVNLKERWRKHLKCGLGIDTPSTNAFYQAMMKYHPWNFTWEVLEYCPKEKLNEVEKHYIDFFQAKTWGWNSKGGNK